MNLKPHTRAERSCAALAVLAILVIGSFDIALCVSVTQARERGDCYAAGKTAATCGTAGAVERFVTAALKVGQ